jgi:sugar/nucleoside kinase (ribokinase family)
VSVGPPSIGSGGDALNVVINLSKLGLKAKITGCIGKDTFGDILLNEASRHGVDTADINRTGVCGTGASIVLIDETGERHFVYHGGGNNLFTASMVTDGMLKDVDCLCINSFFGLPAMEGPGLPVLKALLLKARNSGVLTVMDVTGNPDREKWPSLAEVLPYVDYFLPSEDEAAALTNLSDPTAMIAAFLEAGCGNAIVKCGARGAYISGCTGKEGPVGRANSFVRSFPVKQVDATGAGDAFVAGFVYGLSRGISLHKCVQYGCAVGALCVTGVGATSTTPMETGLYDFLGRNGI